MRHMLQTIDPYHWVKMIVVVEVDPQNNNPEKSLWYLYNKDGKLLKKGYGGWHYPDGIKAPQSALRNAKQAARRYLRKKHPLFFRRG